MQKKGASACVQAKCMHYFTSCVFELQLCERVKVCHSHKMQVKVCDEIMGRRANAHNATEASVKEIAETGGR